MSIDVKLSLLRLCAIRISLNTISCLSIHWRFELLLIVKQLPFSARVQVYLEVLEPTETSVGCRGEELVLVRSKVSNSCMSKVLSLDLLGQLQVPSNL